MTNKDNPSSKQGNEALENEMISECDLGIKYLNGLGVPKDFKAALKHFQRAADLGFPRAQRNLAMMYIKGLGVEVDHNKAVFWSTEAINNGDSEAAYNLAIEYNLGRVFEKDMSKAMPLYEKAALLGNIDAQFNLGVIFEEGKEVKQNIERAAFWFEKAAQQGDNEALFRFKRIKGENTETLETNISKEDLDNVTLENLLKDFYLGEIQEFNKYCTSKGMLNENAPYVPEVTVLGNPLINSILFEIGNEQFGDLDLKTYHFYLTLMCFSYAVYFTSMWHNNFEMFKRNDFKPEGYKEFSKKMLPSIHSLIRKNNGDAISSKEMLDLIKGMLEILLKDVEQKGDISDLLFRDFIVAGMQAFFFIGMNIALNSNGFR